MRLVVILTLALSFFAGHAYADDGRDIGSVNTAFKLIGPDHKVKVAAFDDPKVSGVTCYISRAVTGGIKGAIGVAEDTSDAAIACRGGRRPAIAQCDRARLAPSS